MVKILKHIQNSGKWEITFNGDQITIFIPKFTTLIDEWTQRKLGSKSGQSPKILIPDKEEEVDKEEDKRKKKKKSSPDGSVHPLLKYLISKIDESGNGIKTHKEKLVEFFHYRQNTPKIPIFRTEKGINGLIRECKKCLTVYADLGECLDITMERGWQVPDPEYLDGKAKTIEKEKQENGEVDW